MANAPCSWGVLEFGLEGSNPDYARVLDEMRETGYEGTELGDWGFFPTEPVRLRAELDGRGLALVAAFVPVALADSAQHSTGRATALRIARLLAAVNPEAMIVLADDNAKNPIRAQNAGRIAPSMGLSAEQWRTFAAGANEIAWNVGEETGLRTVFHNHCAGYVETPAEVDRLLDLTDPTRVGLCLDTGHYRFGGGDPLDALGRYKDRVRHVHFKDHNQAVAAQARAEGWDYLNSVRRGIFCELGQGDVNFPAIADSLKRSGYDGWIVVEQDVLPGMGSPKESARRNRDYLRGIGL